MPDHMQLTVKTCFARTEAYVKAMRLHGLDNDDILFSVRTSLADWEAIKDAKTPEDLARMRQRDPNTWEVMKAILEAPE